MGKERTRQSSNCKVLQKRFDKDKRTRVDLQTYGHTTSSNIFGLKNTYDEERLYSLLHSYFKTNFGDLHDLVRRFSNVAAHMSSSFSTLCLFVISFTHLTHEFVPYPVPLYNNAISQQNQRLWTWTLTSINLQMSSNWDLLEILSLDNI